MSDLLPCPFCGYKNVQSGYEIIDHYGDQCDQWYCIKCPNCGAIVTFDDDAAGTIDDVERLYNWRV